MKRYSESEGGICEDPQGNLCLVSDYQAMKKEAQDCLDFSSWLISKYVSIPKFVSEDKLSEFIDCQFKIFKSESENEL
jgi:hypothetical protein